jgi:hypothetical protein
MLEDEKVPISAEEFQYLLSSDPHDAFESEDAEVLFRVSESERSFFLGHLFQSAIRKATPLESGTEASFHALWDMHIGMILEALLPTSTPIRDSNFHTSTQKLRPDFGFLLDNVCLFRGEEKPARNCEDPKAELCDKLTWIYSPAPYIFGETINWLRHEPA